MFESLTRFIPLLEKLENLNVRTGDISLCQGPTLPGVDKFIGAVRKFEKRNPDFNLRAYPIILKENREKIKSEGVSNLDAQIVLALIFSQICAEKFSEGCIDSAVERGKFKTWLLRLKEIDEQTR